MLTFFTWTPHHDHSETGRYRNTRVSLFPGANFMLQGQNYHLIHHMIPAFPITATNRLSTKCVQSLNRRVCGSKGLCQIHGTSMLRRPNGVLAPR